MLTLAFAQLGFVVSFQWRSLTRGDDGLSGIPALTGLGDERALYLLALALLGGSYLLLSRLVQSPLGQVLDAARQNEARARALGYHVFRYRLAAYLLAGALTGLAGALAAHERGFVHPRDFSLAVSATLLIGVILVNQRWLWGPVLGISALVALEAWLSARTEFWNLFLGLLLMAVVLWGRGGLAGLLAQAWRARQRPPAGLRDSHAGAAGRAAV
jgi:branched-chain amino acid transport system permease protein